jgi:hypothetical protein
MRRIRLSEAIRATGYAVRVTRSPARTPGGLGTGRAHMQARAFEGPRGFGVAIKSDSWKYAYAASHEIAEMRQGFKHTAQMFCDQANYLAGWLQLLQGIRPSWVKRRGRKGRVWRLSARS